MSFGRTCVACRKQMTKPIGCTTCGLLLWCSADCRQRSTGVHRQVCEAFLALNTTPGFGFAHFLPSPNERDQGKGVQLFPPSQLSQLRLRKHFNESIPKRKDNEVLALVISAFDMDEFEILEERMCPSADSTVIQDEDRQLTYVTSVMDISRGSVGDMIKGESGDFIDFAAISRPAFIPVVILTIDKQNSLVSGYRLSLLMNNFTKV